MVIDKATVATEIENDLVVLLTQIRRTSQATIDEMLSDEGMYDTGNIPLNQRLLSQMWALEDYEKKIQAAGDLLGIEG